jgi:hypothetical protein
MRPGKTGGWETYMKRENKENWKKQQGHEEEHFVEKGRGDVNKLDM